MKKLIILAICILLASVGLSGCSQVNNTINPQNKFVGTWKTEIHQREEMGNMSNGYVPHIVNYTDTYIFFSDGTLSFTSYGVMIPGDWQIKDGKLVMTTGL